MTATTAITVRRLTPVLIVDAIEPVLPFWEQRLGFTIVAQVPHGDAIGFAILVKDGVELMYQTRASAAEDNAASTPAPGAAADTTALFLEVADIEAVAAAVEGLELVVPRRRTFYGMDELGVREPGGRVVMFAQPVAAADAPADTPAVEPTGT
jgi:uncharacterized glyoxalase superfamily protein PhnB